MIIPPPIRRLIEPEFPLNGLSEEEGDEGGKPPPPPPPPPLVVGSGSEGIVPVRVAAGALADEASVKR